MVVKHALTHSLTHSLTFSRRLTALAGFLITWQLQYSRW